MVKESLAPGQVFGRRVLLEKSKKKYFWVVRCECGKISEVSAGALRGGRADKCFRCSEVTHGGTRDPEYKAYTNMLSRCFNIRRKDFGNYGGRGITVCARWRGHYELFFADMGKRPTRKHTLERIDNDGNYEPGNCRWATRQEQSRNTRRNKRIKLNGEVKVVKDWAEEFGILEDTIRERISRGWPADRAVTEPSRTIKRRHLRALATIMIGVIATGAAFSQALQPVPVASDRALVTLSAGQAVGGGIVSARAQVCNLMQGPQTLDSGWIEQALVNEGFAVTGPTEAAWANQQTRNKNRLIIGSEIAQGGGWTATALVASKIISASGPWGAGAAFGAVSAGQLASFLKGQAPPDFATRYAAQPVMVDNAQIKLNGAMDPDGHACVVQVVFIDLAQTPKTLKTGKKIKATGNMKVRKLRSAIETDAPSFIIGSSPEPAIVSSIYPAISVSSEVNIARSVWLSNVNK